MWRYVFLLFGISLLWAGAAWTQVMVQRLSLTPPQASFSIVAPQDFSTYVLNRLKSGYPLTVNYTLHIRQQPGGDTVAQGQLQRLLRTSHLEQAFELQSGAHVQRFEDASRLLAAVLQVPNLPLAVQHVWQPGTELELTLHVSLDQHARQWWQLLDFSRYWSADGLTLEGQYLAR